MCFKFGTIQEVRENILARTLNILRPWRRLSVTHLKENGIPLRNRWWHDSQRNGCHPVLKSICALSCGILKRKETPYTSVRMLRTQNSYFARFTQLRNNGAVACWCEEFGQMPNETEPTSERFVAKENVQLLKNVKRKKEILLVQTPRSDDPAFGN